MSYPEDYDSFCDDEDCDYCYPKVNNMSKNKDYVVEGGYYYDTLDEAQTDAKRRVSKNSDSLRIYKAIQEISPLTPNVEVKELTIK